MCEEAAVKSIGWLLTDFLGLGVVKDEAGMLDRFFKNILNVAESKFSTAKHLHEVWMGMKTARNWLDRMQGGNSKATWKDGLSNEPGALRQSSTSAIPRFCFFSISWSNTWMRQAAAGICLLKCFCLCFCCTFRAKPEPKIPCEQQQSGVIAY